MSNSGMSWMRPNGKIEPTAKVTLLMEEVENIQVVAPLGATNTRCTRAS